MTSSQAETAVTGSALLTGGTYILRKLIEEEAAGAPSASLTETAGRALTGGELLPLHQWLPLMGFAYITIALVAAGSPTVGGSLALLLATTAVLGNGAPLLKDLGVGQGAAKTALQAKTAPPARAEPSTSNHPPIVQAV